MEAEIESVLEREQASAPVVSSAGALVSMDAEAGWPSAFASVAG
jgi:hypothetical protein